MRESVTSAQLCLQGRGGFTYVVAMVRYIVREDDSFRYELIPNYDVIDLLEPSYFQGIPGFNLDLRKARYVRENKTPTLIADRAPMQNREDLWQLLEECGMDYWDPLEWLVRTDRRYIGDRLYFRAAPLGESAALDIEQTIEGAANSPQAVDAVLTALCEGRPLESDGAQLNSLARKVLYESLMLLYEKMRHGKGSVSVAPRIGRAPAGRKRKPVDELMLREAVLRYRAREWTAKRAAEWLDVSVPTFYRRLAEWEGRAQ